MDLRPYQVRGVQFALAKGASMQMLNMGEGKTAIALTAIARSKVPAIVFAPPNPLYTTWPEEIKKWTPGLRHAILHGDTKHVALRQKADVYLVSWYGVKWFYEQCIAGRFPLRKYFMVFDESTFVKDPSVKRFKYLQKMANMFSRYRMNLTGTPSPEGYHNLWSQYWLLDQGKRMGPHFTTWRSKYFIYYGAPRYQTKLLPMAEKPIFDSVKDITFRLTPQEKKGVKQPTPIYNGIPVVLPKAAMAVYRKFEKDALLEFDDGDIAVSNFDGATQMKLRQISQGFIYTEQGVKVIHTAKAEALRDVLTSLNGEPLLCAVQFKYEKVMIKKLLRKDIPCIDGDSTPAKNRRLVGLWNERRLPLLLCHPQSIGHGMNMQFGGFNVLWYGFTWSMEQYHQLNARLDRSGQPVWARGGRVGVHHLCIAGTKDTDMLAAIGRKDSTQDDLLRFMSHNMTRR